MVRQAFIEDDGDSLQVALVQDDKQVGGMVIDLAILGVDGAYQVAMQLGQCFMNSTGECGDPQSRLSPAASKH